MAGTSKWDSLQKDIIAAVQMLGKKHKVVLEARGYRYDDDTCTFRVQATVATASGAKKDIAREEYLRFAALAGLKKDWLDSVFVENGHAYRIVGYEPGRKYPVKTTRQDGGTYNWTNSFVIEKLGKAKAA